MASGEEQQQAGVRGRKAARRRRVSGMSRRKRLAFAALALALALAALALVEGGLRLAGFGGYPPTFASAGTLDSGSTLVMTRVEGPVSYFFTGRSEGAALDPIAFQMPKPVGRVRVMWVGASAAKGIPQPRHLRASAFLEAMLADVWPDREVEVLNVGVPAIAAYPVLGIMTESLDYDPDLVVVYLGNNEFYGAYGVASLHTAGRSPGMIRLIRTVRSTAIAQAIDAVLPRPKRKPGSLMEKMIGQSSIAPDDPARDAAARNLETFVGDMIDRCDAAGVPVIVCIPVRNESGMAPLGEEVFPTLSSEALDEIRRLTEGAAARVIEDPTRVEADMRRVIELMPLHARAHFLLARALAEQGRFDEANEAFDRAVDLDRMPWRPPATSVQAIRRAAASRNAAVADLAATFAERSDIGSPGWALMDDHVHPSLEGQALVARTVVGTMTGLEGALRVDPEAAATLSDWETYAERLGATPYDRYAVAHAMRMLGSISFFQRSNPEMFEINDAICQAVEAEAAPLVVRAMNAWTDPERRMVDRYPITGMVADAMLQMGRAEEASRLFRIAAADAQPWSAREIGFTYFALYSKAQAGAKLRPEEIDAARDAIERAEFLIRENLDEVTQAQRFAGQLHALLGEHTDAIALLEAARGDLRGSHRVAAEWTLIQSYVATGARAKAMQIIEAGLETEDAAAYRQMGQLIGGAP